MTYAVRRSRVSLCIGYFLAEGVLITSLIGMVIIWRDEPTYMDWPIAIISWTIVALFFHFFLFLGTFYRVQITDDVIEYRAFLRKTKKLHFSDIQKIEPSVGVDIKIGGHNHKTLFYVKLSDRNFDRFMMDLSVYIRERECV